jgi:hypothetical protein
MAKVKLASGSFCDAKVDFVSDSDTVRMELLLDNPNGIHRSGVRCWLVDGERLDESASLPILTGSLDKSERKK